MKILRYLLLAFTAMACSLGASAQANTTSPYSMFGYGILNDYATSSQRAMGGVGYAMNGGRQINVMNPASYAAIDSLTFLWDIGVDVSFLNSKEGNLKANSIGGGLDYITMQFPITKKIGASIGLLPYSSVGYEFGGKILEDSDVLGSESRNGSGGLNLLYAGAAITPVKGLSVGFNVGYLFGTNIYDAYVYSTSTSLYERVIKVHSWDLKIGALYTYNLDKKNKVSVGVTFSPKKSLQGNTWGAYYDITNDTRQDTIGYTSLNGNNYTPMSFGGGISYEYDKRIFVEADFTYQNWKDAKFTSVEGFDNNVNSLTFDNRWKAALGVQYTPQLRGGYMRRVNYRLGAYCTHDYVTVRGNNVREYGVTCGLGLPAPGSKTVINIGFEYKHRATAPVNYITENYFNVTVGVNFNQMWFWKNKIE